jgi:hypothetical protein
MPVPWHTTTAKPTKPMVLVLVLVLVLLTKAIPLQMILNPTRRCQRWRMEHTTTATTTAKTMVLLVLLANAIPLQMILNSTRGGQRWRTRRHANTKQTQQDRRGQSNPDLTTRKKHFLLRRRGVDHRS